MFLLLSLMMEFHLLLVFVIFQAFKIKREGEDKVYRPFRDLNNRKLLWHGSRTTNFAGILSQGLRIAPPEAPVVCYWLVDALLTGCSFFKQLFISFDCLV